MRMPEERVRAGGRMQGVAGAANPEVAEVTVSCWRTWAAKRKRPARRAALEAAGGEFDLILSDIVMAGPMNGWIWPAPFAKAPRPSGCSSHGYSDAAVAAAEFTVLRKPYNVADLDRAIAGARSRQAARQHKVADFQNVRNACVQQK
jgi:DNA-binding LytR/AlgR family response regulator